MEKFKSQGGTSVKEFCPYGTRDECRRNNTERERCTKVDMPIYISYEYRQCYALVRPKRTSHHFLILYEW